MKKSALLNPVLLKSISCSCSQGKQFHYHTGKRPMWWWQKCKGDCSDAQELCVWQSDKSTVHSESIQTPKIFSYFIWPTTCWSLWPNSRDYVWKWEKLLEGKPSLQYSTELGFMAEWPDRSLSLLKRFSDSKEQESVLWWNLDWTVWPQMRNSFPGHYSHLHTGSLELSQGDHRVTGHLHHQGPSSPDCWAGQGPNRSTPFSLNN